MGKIPVIFDCDPGHDDAIALIAALASDSIDIKAVTCVCGNSTLENTTQNALNILALCGRSDIPVASGADKPMMVDTDPGTHVHGKSGMDGPVLTPSPVKASPLKAWDMMAKVVEESDVPVTLIVTGPATNIAIFLLSYPHLKEKISLISFMGGGFAIGNRSPVAEFNVWQDPESAHVLMESGIPVDLYGLDVTHKALILKEEFELFRNQGNPIADFVAELLDFFSIHYVDTVGLDGCPMHDSCAVLGLVQPRLFKYEQCRMEVDLIGHFTRGGVSVDLRTEPRRSYPYNGTFALDVDRPAFLQSLLDACKTVSERRSAQ